MWLCPRPLQAYLAQFEVGASWGSSRVTWVVGRVVPSSTTRVAPTGHTPRAVTCRSGLLCEQGTQVVEGGDAGLLGGQLAAQLCAGGGGGGQLGAQPVQLGVAFGDPLFGGRGPFLLRLRGLLGGAQLGAQPGRLVAGGLGGGVVAAVACSASSVSAAAGLSSPSTGVADRALSDGAPCWLLPAGRAGVGHCLETREQRGGSQ